MAKIYILLFTLIFIPNGAEYCTCAPLPHWNKATPKEYEYVEDVIIADVIIDENEIGYKIIVCEVFKGDLKTSQILNGKILELVDLMSIKTENGFFLEQTQRILK